jgi:uncharacterized protein (DUF885 family)
MSRKPTAIDQIADSYLDWMVAESPSYATYIGRPGGEDKLDDESPAAAAKSASKASEVLRQLAATDAVDDTDRVTKDAMQRTLQLDIDTYDAGLWRRNLNVIASPAQGIRDIFDLSPTATEQDWVHLVGRSNAVEGAIDGYIETLREGIKASDTPAKRQVAWVLNESRKLAGSEGFFRTFAAGAKTANGELPAALKADLEQAANRASDAYGKLAAFLENELLPVATSEDAIGRERYSLLSQSFVGAKLDLDETYEWGKEELARLVAEQEAVANEIKPGASIREAMDHLNSDPKRKLHGKDELQRWMQKLSDKAIEDLGKSHFDLAEPLRKLECMIAPSNSGAIYYTGPSDDFSRPGRMWWSVPDGVTEFDTWTETTTVYHEGVPGHHLQVAQAVYNREELNSWRRLASWTSGHGEGWALYAERLMEQLGYLEDPGDRMGMLDGQRLRALRVVLDIGTHLGKPRLDGTGKWDFDYALAQMHENVYDSPEFLAFETNRYFGWPGQAPSYKVGQRIWEQLRDEAAAKAGANWDIKAWHKKALNLGGIPLDTLRYALSL